MRNINFMLSGLMMLVFSDTRAITIEEISEKNNKIIELDQDIAIAERNKKLLQLNNEISPPGNVATKNVPSKIEELISVPSVHGTPTNPIVDVQYGDSLLQKHRGETLPDGWKIVGIEKNTVNLSKKIPHRPDVIKRVRIGSDIVPVPEINPAESVAIPSHSSVGK